VQQSDGVPFHRARLGLTGDGGMGKSSLRRALTGQPFENELRSTVGADSQIVELHTEQVAIGGVGGRCVMEEYKREAAEHEQAIASAVAAGLKGGSVAPDGAASWLDRVRAAEAKEAEEAAKKLAEEVNSHARRQAAASQSQRALTSEAKAAATMHPKVAPAAMHPKVAPAAISSSPEPSAAVAKDDVAKAPTPPPPPSGSATQLAELNEAEEELATQKSVVELVGREGARMVLKVLFLQDCGGQEIFDLIRHLFGSANSNSVDLLVVSLKAIEQVDALSPRSSHTYVTHSLGCHESQ
jgi:hypothetical protein